MCCYSSEEGDGEAGPREFSTLYSILLCRPTRHLRSVSRIQPDAQVLRKVWLAAIALVKTNIFFDWNKCKIRFIQKRLIFKRKKKRGGGQFKGKSAIIERDHWYYSIGEVRCS